MMTDKRLNTLLAMGASRWTKYGRDRLYLRNCYKDLLKMKVSYYNSGNISSASIDGEGISNSEARRIQDMAEYCYIDLIKDEIVVDGKETSRISNFKALIYGAIEEL